MLQAAAPDELEAVVVTWPLELLPVVGSVVPPVLLVPGCPELLPIDPIEA